MNKTLIIMRHEIMTTITRRSFLLTTFGLPLISALVLFIVSVVNQKNPTAVSNVFGSGSQTQQFRPEGYVDQSGIIRTIPDIPQGALKAFSNEAGARQAMNTGEITAYYLIPADYLASGQIVYVRPDFNPLTAFDQAGLIQWVLAVNLAGGDVQRASLLQQPIQVTVENRAPTPQRDDNNPLTFILPYVVTMIYYFVILMAASLLLNSVTKEKENRVIEILMSTISPRQLLTGKIIGLGLVGLIQTVLWVGTGFAMLRLSGKAFSIPAAFQLPPSFLLWALVFFLLGYAVYASLMAAVGAMVPNLREASQATIVVILPLLIPMMAISVLAEEPNGTLAMVLSLFPLTSPVTMMTRLAATSVPLWEILLSAGLLAATAVLIVRAVAGMFRAQTLLSGQSFNLKVLLNALTGRA